MQRPTTKPNQPTEGRWWHEVFIQQNLSVEFSSGCVLAFEFIAVAGLLSVLEQEGSIRTRNVFFFFFSLLGEQERARAHEQQEAFVDKAIARTKLLIRGLSFFFFFPLSHHNHQVGHFCRLWCVLGMFELP